MLGSASMFIMSPMNRQMNMKYPTNLIPHHQPLRPVSCSLLKVNGMVRILSIIAANGTATDTMMTNSIVHQYSDLRARPEIWKILLVALFTASLKFSDSYCISCSIIIPPYPIMSLQISSYRRYW